MAERNMKQILLGEIGGKNAAIHAYDRIIWIIRSGYLTLFFLSWGLILRAIIENNPAQEIINRYIPLMLVMSFGLTIGGIIVDLDYVLRKFRVIGSLNKMMELTFKFGDEINDFDLGKLNNDQESLLRTLCVAGDAGKSPFGLTALYFFCSMVF